MENVKLIETIKKLFALSKNNPSAQEAQAAALKAQELMANNNVSMAEVEDASLDKVEEIKEVKVDLPSRKWKYDLVHIVKSNFRCECYFFGTEKVVFFGHETDAQIASETFKYLYNMGNALGNKLAREARAKYGWADNVYNSCVVGFCQGVRDALAEQSKALMVVTPQDVKDEFAERTKHCRHRHLSGVRAYKGDAFNRGREQGYNAMKRNALNG